MNLVIPILVRETPRPDRQPPLFTVRPLFRSQPRAQGEHLSRAVTRLANELRKMLDRMGRRARQDELLSWTFCPRIHEHYLKARLQLRRGTAEVRVLVTSIEALGRRIAMMPALPHRWFEVVRGQKVLDRAREILVDHFNELQRESEDFEVPDHFTPKSREWVTTLEIDVHLEPEFNPPPGNLFALLGGGEKMSGREELHKVGRCLDWLYPDELDRAMLRDAEVAELERLLHGSDKRPVLLLGPPRVGKTAVVHECVFRRVKESRSPHVSEENVWLLAPQRLISGMSYVGEWENRVLAIFAEATRRGHVLYFDDVLGLYYAGLSASSDLTVAHVLKPFLERREFRVLAEMTPEAFRILQERDRGMADLFHVIPLRPTSESDTRKVLMEVMRQLEARYRCIFSLDVLPQVLELSNRYQREFSQPGKSALFMRQLAARHKSATISRHSVLEDFHSGSGLSITFLDSSARLKREDVTRALTDRITGQSEAVDAMSDAVCLAKARLNDPGRPLATFLFLGPTGVGKTQCAKALAQFLFGNANRLLRFDMNEYVDASAVWRLNGTFREPEGLLTAAIRRQPFSVVLFDEIEKADPSVFDLLLQVLGEGRLTDALGRTADFGNAIIVMTSNLGAREAGASFGLRPADRSDRDVYVACAERFFRPEFFNRIDRVVPFERLTRPQVAEIANRLIQDVFRRDGLVHRRCVLDVEPAAMESVVNQGYHPQLGARALKRAIERQLTQPVAAKLAGMAPDTPAVIRLYTAQDGIASQIQPLVHAERRPIVPAALDLDDWSDVLDRAEEAIDRIEAEAHRDAPDGRLTQGQLSTEHFRYLAVREYAQHLYRFIEQIDRRAGANHQATRMSRPPSRALRGPKKSLALIGAETRAWRDLRAAQDLKAHLATFETDQSRFGEAVRDQLMELIHETALLEAMADRRAGDRCLLWLRSPTRCADELDCLQERYLRLFGRSYGFAAAELEEVAAFERAVLAEMPGVFRTLGIEEGTHLFAPAGRELIPIQLRIVPVDATNPDDTLRLLRSRDEDWRGALGSGKASVDSDPFPFGPVIRLYEKESLTIDLRSGLVATGLPTSEELRKFILSQLPPPPEFGDE